jgi:hypothetical protein
MARQIQIPFSFDFRTTKVQWEEARASVIGWRNQQGETNDPVHLIAGIASTTGKKKTIGLPLSRLPNREKEQCLATLGKRHMDEAVKEICAGLELRYFVHDSKTYIKDSELRKHSHAADAWQLREDFLSLRGDSEAALAVLNKWGRWIPWRTHVDMVEILALQRAVRHALTSPAEIWFRSLYASPPKVNSRSSEFPYFVILTDACEAAIRTTTTIDLLRKLKFKTCARPDCPMVFPIKSKHERNYCRQYCAHLESVRRARKSTAQRTGG